MAIIIEYTSHTFKGIGSINKELYNHLRLALEFEPNARLFDITNWSFMRPKLKKAFYLLVICGFSAIIEPFTANSKFLSAIFLIVTIPSVLLLFGIILRIAFETRSFLGYKMDANIYHKRLRKSIKETSNYEDFIRVFSKRLGHHENASRLDQLMTNPNLKNPTSTEA